MKTILRLHHPHPFPPDRRSKLRESPFEGGRSAQGGCPSPQTRSVYSLKNPLHRFATLACLMFFSLGLRAQEIKPINPNLLARTDSMIAHAIVCKIGFVVTVRESPLDLAFYTSPEQILQGRVAGVWATQASWQPGGEMAVRIRGVQSLVSGAEPLYVIDGFPIYNDNDAASAGFTFGPRLNALAMFHPADVESITVRKDAAATALHGARGSNGVVEIQTKKGAFNRSRVEFRAQGGFQTAIGQYELLDATQFASYLNEAATNAGLAAPYANPASFGAGTDWQQEMYRDRSTMQDYQVAISGGSEHMRYRVAASYLQNRGLIHRSRLDRVNLHANLEAKVKPRLTLRNTLNISRIEANTVATDDPGNTSGTGVVSGALLFNPLLPATSANGNLTLLNRAVGNDGALLDAMQAGFTVASPSAQALLTDSKAQNTRLFDRLSLEYAFSDPLRLTVSAGIDALFNDEFAFVPGALEPDLPAAGMGAGAKLQSYQWFNQYALNYDKTWKEKHVLSASGGFAMQGFSSEVLSGVSRSFDNETLRFYNLFVGGQKTINSGVESWGLVSGFARFNYLYDKKYEWQLVGRMDASSRFGGEYGLFPAGAFTWHLAEEDFIRLPQLDLRLSYGITGNQEISPYSTLAVLNQLQASLNNQPVRGFRPINLANESLEMERTRQVNLGMDLGLFNNTVSISLDAYAKRTDNAILYLPVPAQSGFSFLLANGAEIRNQGIDLAISTHQAGHAFDWYATLTAGYVKNEIYSLAAAPTIPVGAYHAIQVGAQVGALYGYVSDGVLQSGQGNVPAFAGQSLQPGDPIYRDLNGDGRIDIRDQTVIGEPIPDLVYGLVNTFAYKGFSLDIFVQGTVGNEIANLNRLFLDNLNGTSNITQAAYDNRWTAANPSQTYPRPLAGPDRAGVFSDAIIEDGSYLRIKSLRISYEVPEKAVEKLKLSTLRLFLLGQNLLTLTGYSGIDPELSHFGQSAMQAGADLGAYPQAKLFLGGIEVGF